MAHTCRRTGWDRRRGAGVSHSRKRLRMVYEIYKQMQGEAGPRQRRNPILGMTHNHGMNPGSGVGSVTILGQRD